MKIGGIDPKSLPKHEILVLPKGDQLLVFTAQGISDLTEFNKLCPEPVPPGKLVPGQGWVPNAGDKNYQTVLTEFNKRRFAYMVVKGLEPSNIEWDTVDINNPATWSNWSEDLKNAGLSNNECLRITNLILDANCLNEERLKQARENFVRGHRPELAVFSGPSTEPENTPSGEPVSE